MTMCDDVLDAVELIASGELTPDEQTAAHLTTCASCASALEAAQRLEVLLRQRPVAAPPPQFTSRTMARIRRARWRNEQVIDWVFNVVLVAVAVMVAAGLWTIASRSGLTSVNSEALDLLATATKTIVRRVSPSLPLYALATALLVSALGIWWWAERDTAI